MISKKCFKAANIPIEEQKEILAEMTGKMEMGMDKRKAALSVVSKLTKDAKKEQSDIKDFIKKNKPPEKPVVEKPVKKPVEQKVAPTPSEEKPPIGEPPPVKAEPKISPPKDLKPEEVEGITIEQDGKKVSAKAELEKADNEVLSYRTLKDCAL